MKEVDFGLSWSVRTKEYFIETLRRECEKRKLSFLWVCEDKVSEVIKKLENNELRIHFLLDTEATYNKAKDRYARLSYATKDAGGVVINDPDRARLAVDKSVMHYELINAGIYTPYSIIVRNWQPNTFRLSDEEKQKLGIPFVIKPACGYARLGVVEEAYGSIREIAGARNFDRGDNFLLQKKIIPLQLGQRRAWFRVFHIFDTIIPCWWDDLHCVYSSVSREEFKKYSLSSLVKIVAKIGEITQLQWFSTEIAVHQDNDQVRFIAIDYVNDQCDMTAQSEKENGVPDDIVAYTASRIVEASHQLINKQEMNKDYTVWFKDTEAIQIKGLGNAPEPLTQAEI